MRTIQAIGLALLSLVIAASFVGLAVYLSTTQPILSLVIIVLLMIVVLSYSIYVSLPVGGLRRRNK